MKSTTKTVLSVFLTNLVAICINHIPSAHAQDSGTASAGTAWVSSPIYAKQLGAEVKVDDYNVCPPSGYYLEKTQKIGKFNVHDEFMWVGPKRTDGSVARFRVEVYKWLPGVEDHGTPEQWLTRGLNAVNKGNSPIAHSPIALGQINGMEFARAYYKELPASTHKGSFYHGFEYISPQGPVLVSVICSDTASYYKSTLDLMEAAALTLHK